MNNRERLRSGGCALLLLAALSTTPAHADDDEYKLGQGYNWRDYNFAGYADVVSYIPNQSGSAQVMGTASLFVSAHISSYWNPFLETQISSSGVATSNTAISNPGVDRSLSGGRFYDDIEMTDSLTLRLGNMLTPVGAWNQMPAPALVLTTARPAVTDLNFSNYLAGMSVNYTDPDGGLPDLQVYWQPVRDLSEQQSGGVVSAYQYTHSKMVEGIHASLPLSPLDQIGVSVQRSRNLVDTDQTLLGLDFKYTVSALTIQGEFSYSDLSGNLRNVLRDHETGAYVAVSYALGERWALTSWLEEYSGRNTTGVARDVLTGVVYHPLPPMALKLEYLQNYGGQPVNPTGFLMSWSVLF